MKLNIRYEINETLVQVIHDNGEIVVKNGVLLEGNQLCVIYDLDEESFPYVCSLDYDLAHMLTTQGLKIRVVHWENERYEDERIENMLYVCNECDEMHTDEKSICEVCNCESFRIVLKSELLN